MAEGKFVSYVRVSTDRQGRSGLGLEAQRTAVDQYLNGGSWELIKEYREVESGKRADRPELQKALALCRATGATLLIAKLDRLSRDAHFLLGLQKAGVRFVAADMPDATDFTVGIMAMVAQQEREAISRRTKDALAAVRAEIAKEGEYISQRSGKPIKKLGNPEASANLRPGAGQEAATQAAQEAASRRAADLRHVVEELRGQGVTSVRGLAAALNGQGIRTPRGKQWHPTGVTRLLERLQKVPS